MNEIKCVGINEKNLHPQQFYAMFIQECQKEGQIVNIRVNNRFAAAIVIGQ